jgi:hypothetical protein
MNIILRSIKNVRKILEQYGVLSKREKPYCFYCKYSDNPFNWVCKHPTNVKKKLIEEENWLNNAIYKKEYLKHPSELNANNRLRQIQCYMDNNP